MIEIKFQFTSLAAAAAFLADAAGDPRFVPTGALLAGEVNSAETTVVSNPSPEAVQAATQEAPKAEGKRGPGRPRKAAEPEESPSAAPAEAPSAAKDPEPASTPAAPAVKAEPPKAKTYEETDFPKRIMQIVADQKATGNDVRVSALKAALAELGLKSARELKPEQLDGFGEKLAEIEAIPFGEEALG